MLVQSLRLAGTFVKGLLKNSYKVCTVLDVDTGGRYRIGELSHRTGVSPELLRAWERRYGLMQPERSGGGFRLYSPADEARVRRMQQHLAQGIAAAEAARLALETPAGEASQAGTMEEIAAQLTRALEDFDEAGGNRALDAALASFSLDSVIGGLLVPYLHELGERWERGEVTIAQEHFASNVIRARLLALGRDWGSGYGPRALLACPGGELHDLGLLLFGLALGRRGWRITFLGADTPLSTILWTATQVNPDAIVIAISDARHVVGLEDMLQRLTDSHHVYLAGRGASELAGVTKAEVWEVGPITAAEELAAAVAAGA